MGKDSGFHDAGQPPGYVQRFGSILQYAVDSVDDCLPETNIAPEMDGWKTSFLLGWPIFRGHVSFWEGRFFIPPFTNVFLKIPTCRVAFCPSTAMNHPCKLKLNVEIAIFKEQLPHVLTPGGSFAQIG